MPLLPPIPSNYDPPLEFLKRLAGSALGLPSKPWRRLSYKGDCDNTITLWTLFYTESIRAVATEADSLWPNRYRVRLYTRGLSPQRFQARGDRLLTALDESEAGFYFLPPDATNEWALFTVEVDREYFAAWQQANPPQPPRFVVEAPKPPPPFGDPPKPHYLLDAPCPRRGSHHGEIGEGSRVHAARVVCADCDRFIKWLSKSEVKEWGVSK